MPLYIVNSFFILIALSFLLFCNLTSIAHLLLEEAVIHAEFLPNKFQRSHEKIPNLLSILLEFYSLRFFQNEESADKKIIFCFFIL
jgi:hypothetical protein